ncbi:hypothetical protein EJ110_NYTH35546 [Nymphaea thermarum]|nr:hypothetical protein EJ110_NYTH35546 [Nymphaea thermarum]
MFEPLGRAWVNDFMLDEGFGHLPSSSPTTGDRSAKWRSPGVAGVEGGGSTARWKTDSAPKKSWASIAEGKNDLEWEDALDLPDLDVHEINGKRALVIPIEEHERLERTLLDSCLFGSSIERNFDLRAMACQWELIGGMQVGAWKILENRGVSRVPLWIRLPDVPMHTWNRKIFAGIAKLPVGCLIDDDAYTKSLTRYGYARLLISVPLDFVPDSLVCIMDGDYVF